MDQSKGGETNNNRIGKVIIIYNLDIEEIQKARRTFF
jgi:hypothetical protein